MSDENSWRRPQLEDYQKALDSMGMYLDVFPEDVMSVAERAGNFAHQRINEKYSVSQIMSHPVHFVHPETPMSEAAHLMVSERISGLPVINDSNRIVGIITEADFLRSLGLPAHYPTHNVWQTLEAMFSHIGQHTQPGRPEDPVSAHMVHDVVCTTPDDNVLGVLDLMKRHQIKRVVVCNQARYLLGMIARSDLMRIFFDHYTRNEVDERNA